MQISFDLDEFLSYLLSGAIFIYLLFLMDIQSKLTISNVAEERLSDFGGILGITLYFSVSLLLGHVSSVLARVFVRPVLRKLFYNPRNDLLDGTSEFLDNVSISKIRQNFSNVFGLELEEKNIQQYAPRYIRSYVLNNFETTRSIRNRIVRARSFCANCVIPILLLAVFFLVNTSICFGFLLFAIACCMLWKQMDLDIREWKEIYSSFAIIKFQDMG